MQTLKRFIFTKEELRTVFENIKPIELNNSGFMLDMCEIASYKDMNLYVCPMLSDPRKGATWVWMRYGKPISELEHGSWAFLESNPMISEVLMKSEDMNQIVKKAWLKFFSEYNPTIERKYSLDHEFKLNITSNNKNPLLLKFKASFRDGAYQAEVIFSSYMIGDQKIKIAFDKLNRATEDVFFLHLEKMFKRIKTIGLKYFSETNLSDFFYSHYERKEKEINEALLSGFI
jgi:hypothetical protein